MRQTTLAAFCAALMVYPAVAGVTTVTYPNFSSTTGLNLVGSAATAVGFNNNAVLRLSPSVGYQSGAAWSTTPIAFYSANGMFSTYFQFRFSSPVNGGADGIVFVLQNQANNAGGSGGSIGYGGIAPSVGIEFDTWNNGNTPGYADPNNNHAGIDVNGGMISLLTASPGGQTTGCGAGTYQFNCLSNGDVWSVWIDYDGTNLVVALADNSSQRPANLISYPINVPCVLSGGTVGGTGCPAPATSAYVGFTSGTGFAYENHDILNWTYINSYSPINSSAAAVPALTPLAEGSLALALAALATMILRKRRADSDPSAII